MCCFSRPVERVEQTRIFARGDGPRQLVVYELRLAAREDLAMVLPIPIASDSAEGAVSFVDLTSSPTFFAALDYAFRPVRVSDELQLQSRGRPPLAVEQVGSFEASFVPRAEDFDRLDPRFAIPSGLWASVPAVSDFGFVVFKMRVPKAGLFERMFGSKTIATRAFHPMAFWFPRADRERVFFPTLHVHDGRVHTQAAFDHVLYAQSSEAPEGWDVSDHAMQIGVSGGGRDLVRAQPGQRRSLTGSLPNADVWIKG